MKKPAVVVLVCASLALLCIAIYSMSKKRGLSFVDPAPFVQGKSNTLRGVDDVRKGRKDLLIPTMERNIDGAMIKRFKP